jgi:hypothetical protein
MIHPGNARGDDFIPLLICNLGYNNRGGAPVSGQMLNSIADNPDERLILYGSLAPGGVNDFLLAGLEGDWQRCQIRGRMGRYKGFKSFKWDPEGPEHTVWLFSSPSLPARLPELDDFEGEDYHRILIPARVGNEWIIANIYEGKYPE